jgi:hypothetical protein
VCGAASGGGRGGAPGSERRMREVAGRDREVSERNEDEDNQLRLGGRGAKW